MLSPSFIIHHYGFELPYEIDQLKIKENITYDEIDCEYVKNNMGAIVVRGLWYPNANGSPPR